MHTKWSCQNTSQDFEYQRSIDIYLGQSTNLWTQDKVGVNLRAKQKRERERERSEPGGRSRFSTLESKSGTFKFIPQQNSGFPQ